MPSFALRFLSSVAAVLCLVYGLLVECSAAEPGDTRTSADRDRLQAVVQFADNVLAKGRDRYGEKPTPLFVDGIQVDTGEPVRWVAGGQEWIPSNLASQQNLFRTLVGLTNLTGEPRYRQAAEKTIRYHFEHLRSPCGLLRWGGHRFIDLSSGRVVGEQNSHELKFNLPYYELMHDVDPAATEQYLKAFWNAHILDWGRLDMNRHGRYGKSMGALWENRFDDPEPFFEGDGLTFLNSGTDLIYAGVMLHQFIGDRGALVWSLRLAEQYVKARHPETGLGVYQYSKPVRRQQPPETGSLPTTSNYGDRAENQFGAEFGEVAREGYLLRSPASIYGNNAIVQLQLAELLGDEGRPLLDWTREGLLAAARHVYHPSTNRVRPMWADGTDLTDYVVKRDGYYGRAGTVFRAQTAPTLLFWSYALGHRLTSAGQLWDTARSMARGHGLGDLGSAPGEAVAVNLDTDLADPIALFGILEVCRTADIPEYRQLARRVGDNLVRQRFHQGFFLPSARHIHANFNAIEPLAILTLDAMLRGTPEAVPRYNSGHGFIHGPHDGYGRTTDATAIWAQTRSAR
jgi:pectate lyase